MSLIACLQEVQDPRRLQGLRYSHTAMLLLIIMGILRGQYAYREIGRFCRNNKSYLVARFGFRSRKVPSHVSIRTFIKSVDFASIQAAFHKWTRSYVHIEPGDWIAIDGKSIRSTVSDYSTAYQNFVSLVSLFCSKREQVFRVEKLENKKGEEGQTVESLLDFLDLKGAIFTLDALHCKKNAEKGCKQRQSLPGKGKRQSAETESGSRRSRNKP
jgi:hypothetical protein